MNIVYNENALDGLKKFPDGIAYTCVTSPPYFGLRDYGTGTWIGGDENCSHMRDTKRSDKTITGHKNFDEMNGVGDAIYKDVCKRCGAIRKDQQIGLEETPEEYVQRMVEVFREVKRVLRDDGTVWLNVGDSYYSGNGSQVPDSKRTEESERGYLGTATRPKMAEDAKKKDLIGIPWMLAFALRNDGWYLRQDIIWCLSGGTSLYVKTSHGHCVMTAKDLYRLNYGDVQLWNGKKWTNLVGMSRNRRTGFEMELVLRSGERIGCTDSHKFPTDSGIKRADEVIIGDTLIRTQLPESDHCDSVIDNDAAWFSGLYLAEGSRSGACIQISGHSKEVDRLEKLERIAKKFDGHIAYTIDGNKMNIRLYGKILNAIIDEYISGKVARNKCASPSVWRRDNTFLESFLDGYLSGDGHWDGSRWRLKFTRNYNLERDLRVLCARLGFHLVLNISQATFDGRIFPAFRGEIRKDRSGHFNEKSTCEVVGIRKSRCRYIYDIEVEDDPHIFALSSGILTHNSKPNPMPESVTDRCTKAHEYIFLLSKSPRYYYDSDAIKEPAMETSISKQRRAVSDTHKLVKGAPGQTPHTLAKPRPNDPNRVINSIRNKRSVWNVNTKPYKGAHFAVFPEELIEPCILAGCPEGGIVLDPFMGSGTTAVVAKKNNRQYIGTELNPEYMRLIEERVEKAEVKPSLRHVNQFFDV